MTIGAFPASELARRFGTPLFTYDAEAIRQRARTLHDLGCFTSVLYSAKANANVHVLRLMRGLGMGLEASSPADLLLAAAAGFEPDDVVFTGFGLSDGDVRLVVESGVLFVADSVSQLDRYGQLRPGSAVGLRINPGIVAGFHAAVHAGAPDSKFGIHPQLVPEALAVARRHRLSVRMLAGHVGSDLLHDGPHLRLLDLLLELGGAIEELERISLGGGWGIPLAQGTEPYPFEHFARETHVRLRAFEQARRRRLDLHIEPGSFLVMDSGLLLTSVTDLKPSIQRDGISTPWFVATDTSFNHVVSAMLYRTPHPIWAVDRVDEPSLTRCTVVGNLMQAADVIARDCALPAVDLGDVLAIGKCGGYAYSRASTFNQRERPAEVMVDGAEVSLIRRRERPEDFLPRWES